MRRSNLALKFNYPVGSHASISVNSPKILNTQAATSCQVRLSDPPARSYYAASAPAVQSVAPPRMPLEGEHRADVCVVGAGIAGLSTALHLAKRGYSVAVLEARHVGYGASGRSGGQTIFGLAASQQKLIGLVAVSYTHLRRRP